MPVVEPNGVVSYLAPISATSSRVALGTLPSRTIFIRNAKTSAGTLFVGDNTVTSAGAGNVFVDLQPGEGIFIDLANASLLNIVAATTATAYVAGLR